MGKGLVWWKREPFMIVKSLPVVGWWWWVVTKVGVLLGEEKFIDKKGHTKGCLAVGFCTSMQIERPTLASYMDLLMSQN